jgi:streptogramin lyase
MITHRSFRCARNAVVHSAGWKHGGPPQSKNGRIELENVPTENALPYGIAINSTGVAFFCELGANKMARIDPGTMKITEFKLPETARPRRLAIASDDQVYFADFKSGNLGAAESTPVAACTAACA